MAAIYYRNKNGKFVEIPLGEGVSDSSIAEAIDNYFKKYPINITETDPTVPDWAKQENKPIYTADEVGAYSKDKIDMDFKGIYIAMGSLSESVGGMKTDIDGLQQQVREESHFRGYLATNAQIKELSATPNDFAYSAESGTKWLYDGLLGIWVDTNTPVPDQLTPETILYEGVVDTPVWTNQPTIEGTLDAAFNTTDFYYVTLKDASGNALPDGQFMLKDFYTEGAPIYSTVFTLSGLNTGLSTLVEDFPVEFTSIGDSVIMRDAGVWQASLSNIKWDLEGSLGKLRIVCNGEFIQRKASAYFITCFSPYRNVSFYHSVDSTAMQSDSTKQIMAYAPLSSVASYKANKFLDDSTIERLCDGKFIAQRDVTLRCVNYLNTTQTKVMANRVIGYGNSPVENNYINMVRIQVAARDTFGCIRNGSVLRVTEVK